MQVACQRYRQTPTDAKTSFDREGAIASLKSLVNQPLAFAA